MRRQRLQERWLRDGVTALDALGGRGAVASESALLAACQVAAVRHLAALYGSVGPPPPEYDPLRAWTALQGEGSGYAEDALADSFGVCYQRGKVSLPQREAGLVELCDVVPPELHSVLVSGEGLLCSAVAADEALRAAGEACAMDPVLRRRGHDYGWFLGELFHEEIRAGRHPPPEAKRWALQFGL